MLRTAFGLEPRWVRALIWFLAPPSVLCHILNHARNGPARRHPVPAYWGHPRDKRERLGAARQRGFGRRKDPVEEITTVAGDQILRTLRRADGFVLD